MFQIKLDTIRERTTNGPTYMKGRQYYRDGQVKRLSYDPDKGIVLAQVEGTRVYDVRVILDGNGELYDATCTCSAFTAYWGLCRHIAAVLLYCIDAYGQEHTHITPAGKPEAYVDVNGETEPASAKAQQQARRRSRTRTRDFLARLDHVVSLAESHKQTVRFQVTLFAARSAGALPWLTFSIGTDTLHPIASIEQFAEAISRDLPLELDKEFSFDPLHHCFPSQDLPLVRMIQDAFENDYKSVFGTSHAASHNNCFTLNASRFADFLRFCDQLSDCSWQDTVKAARLPVQVRQTDLPLALLLSENPSHDQDGMPYRLEMTSQGTVQQLTASRNIYLVDDVFYLPPAGNTRLLEPILSTFNTSGSQMLYLTTQEASWLISIMSRELQEFCPLKLQAELESRLVLEPLQAFIKLDASASGLKATVSWQYGSCRLTPNREKSEKEDDLKAADTKLIKRDFLQEKKVLNALLTAGFNWQGNRLRLNDPDFIFAFLDQSLAELKSLAQVNLSTAARQVVIRPAPDIRVNFRWLEDQDSLLLEQHYGDMPAIEQAHYLQALREKKRYIRNADGSFRRINQQHGNLLLALHDLLRLWQTAPNDQITLPRYRALSLEPIIQQLQNREAESATSPPLISIDERIIELINHLREPGALNFRIPQSLSRQLRPYQKKGVHWLCMLDYYGLGGILADDMGLGKTLQTIAFIQMLWNRRKKTSLIIAPTSLIYNWLSEFEKFAPRLPVLLIDGNRQQRSSLLGDLDKYACVITSYALLRRDIDTIKEYAFASCFLDEAQNIKNPDTLNARSVKQVRTDRGFALTGTPLENSLLELWSIYDFVLPGYLHSKRIFQNRFEIPVTRDNNNEVLKELQQLIRPFILRRMKKEVLHELPDKIESRTICDMTPEQREIYLSFLDRSRTDLQQELSSSGYARSQLYILALLTRLRQICCHPALFLPQYNGGSGKLLLLEELLADSFSAGHRVLVFSQFTSMLELIRANQKEQGIKPFYIDGQVTSEERLNQVERFNAGEGKLFLISLRAGGTGLNLTGADTVIHYDPWWNPAVEEQATDRAYRIGQENVVQVFKLFTRHSVEEKIQKLQQKKQDLIDSVIKPGQNLLSKMSLEEVMSLFEP